MGGLIVKSLIVANRNHAQRNALVQSVRGIIFCGTPHRGSDFAKAAALLIPYLSIGGTLWAGLLTLTLPFPLYPPTWARRFGEDRKGIFAECEIHGIAFPFRWMPPGRFLMGSPEEETGRYDDETQHEVWMSRGYWLGETAVTQGQWEAVMGENPSSFKGGERPVEQVSWHDCQEFVKRINGACEGLGALAERGGVGIWVSRGDARGVSRRGLALRGC